MTITLRTGMAIATQVVKHLCRILITYRPAMDGVLAQAVTAGHITAAQKLLLDSWLDGAAAACDVLRLVSGY
jgi:hypothetical protein